jgi:hypothetical protein
MTTINQIKTQAGKIDKTADNLAIEQAKLGGMLRQYKGEQLEKNVKPKDFYAEIQQEIGYKKAMTCQLIQLKGNCEQFGAIFTLSASRYIQEKRKEDGFEEHVEAICEENKDKRIEKPMLLVEKPKSDKSTEEKMSAIFKTAVAIALKGKKLGDYNYDLFVAQTNSELIKVVKEAFENE